MRWNRLLLVAALLTLPVVTGCGHSHHHHHGYWR